MKSNKYIFKKVPLLRGIRDYLTVNILLVFYFQNNDDYDRKIFHLGNFPNQSDQFRIVQYIAFEPSREDDKNELTRRIDAFQMRRISAKVDEQLAGFPEPQLTELGEKIVGLRSWKTNERAKSSFE